MKPDIREVIKKKRLFFDGGTGTVFQTRGLRPGEAPEEWNLSRPGEVTALHAEYISAGCDIIKTNTFGINAGRYPRWREMISAAFACAREAERRAGEVYVAFDIGPTGRLLEPLGDLPFEEAVSLFAKNAKAAEEEGADLILIETMNDGYETKACVLAAKENSSLPVIVTNVYDTEGRLLTGATAESMVAMLEGLKVDALGINCSLAPEEMYPIVKRLVEKSSTPVVVNPNAGLPVVKDGKTVFTVGPEEFVRQMTDIAGLGIQVAGGCCGTTPEHIRLLKKTLSALPFKQIEPKYDCVVSSGSETVYIGQKTVIIGERINPTGKKRFKEALREGDIDYILGEGLRQEDQGADILDVNVGLPEIDEPKMM